MVSWGGGNRTKMRKQIKFQLGDISGQIMLENAERILSTNVSWLKE